MLPAADELGGEQDLQVLGDVRLAEGRGLHEPGDGALAVAQLVKDVQSRGFGAGAKPFGDQREHLGGERKRERLSVKKASLPFHHVLASRGKACSHET